MSNDTETTHVAKSSLLAKIGLSVRGCVVIVVTVTVCGMSFAGKNVAEPLYSLAGMVIGYYFGQMKHTQQS